MGFLLVFYTLRSSKSNHLRVIPIFIVLKSDRKRKWALCGATWRNRHDHLIGRYRFPSSVLCIGRYRFPSSVLYTAFISHSLRVISEIQCVNIEPEVVLASRGRGTPEMTSPFDLS
jgi:hypothetical protein